MESQQDVGIVVLMVVVVMCLTVFLTRALGPAGGLLSLIS
jgi:hypothetical protein